VGPVIDGVTGLEGAKPRSLSSINTSVDIEINPVAHALTRWCHPFKDEALP